MLRKQVLKLFSRMFELLKQKCPPSLPNFDMGSSVCALHCELKVHSHKIRNFCVALVADVCYLPAGAGFDKGSSPMHATTDAQEGRAREALAIAHHFR